MGPATNTSLSITDALRRRISRDDGFAILTALSFSTILGVVISVNTGHLFILIFFLVSQAARLITAVTTIKIPDQVMGAIPVLHLIFIALAGYLASDPIFAGMFLFEYIMFNALNFKPQFALFWSLMAAIGYVLAVVLNSNAVTQSPSFIVGGSTAIGIALSVAYVMSSYISRSSDDYQSDRRKLEKSNARYDVLLNSVGDGMVIVDKGGFIQFINHRALDLLSEKRSTLLGQPISAAILMRDHNDHPMRHSDYPVTDVLATGERLVSNLTSKMTYKIVKSDNTVFPVSLTVSPVLVMGQIDGVVVLFNDSSDFEEMEKAKSEFVSLASHQLRTPLNVVSWYAEKLLKQKKGALNTKQLDYVTEIQTSNARMISLVSDLLNVSRVDLGRRKRKHHEVDFTKLVDDLMREVRQLADNKGQIFNSVMPKEQVVFSDGDLSMLTVIVQNLLSNAIKYTNEGGNINLQVNIIEQGTEIDPQRRVTAEKKGILMSVSDSGVGIPSAQKDQIFSRLFRADNVQTMDVEGTGLGLYVAHSFARMLDGDIWFESQEGKGTTFYVYLPF